MLSIVDLMYGHNHLVVVNRLSSIDLSSFASKINNKGSVARQLSGRMTDSIERTRVRILFATVLRLNIFFTLIKIIILKVVDSLYPVIIL